MLVNWAGIAAIVINTDVSGWLARGVITECDLKIGVALP